MQDDKQRAAASARALLAEAASAPESLRRDRGEGARRAALRFLRSVEENYLSPGAYQVYAPARPYGAGYPAYAPHPYHPQASHMGFSPFYSPPSPYPPMGPDHYPSHPAYPTYHGAHPSYQLPPPIPVYAHPRAMAQGRASAMNPYAYRGSWLQRNGGALAGAGAALATGLAAGAYGMRRYHGLAIEKEHNARLNGPQPQSQGLIKDMTGALDQWKKNEIERKKLREKNDALRAAQAKKP